MRVSIFGLSYVGCATALALARRGHSVIAVDVDERKVRMLNRGESPILEHNLDALIRFYARCGKLTGYGDATKAVCETDVSLIAVESPTKPNGTFDYSCLLNAVWQVAEGLKEKNAYHVVALRSAVPPGTTESLVIPELEKISGKSAGKEFAVCFNPELLPREPREDAISHQTVVIVGSRGGRTPKVLAELYEGIGTICCTPIRTAEMLKYTCDAKAHQTTLHEMSGNSSDPGADVRASLHLLGQDPELKCQPVEGEVENLTLGDERALPPHKLTTNY